MAKYPQPPEPAEYTYRITQHGPSFRENLAADVLLKLIDYCERAERVGEPRHIASLAAAYASALIQELADKGSPERQAKDAADDARAEGDRANAAVKALKYAARSRASNFNFDEWAELCRRAGVDPSKPEDSNE